MMKKNKCVQSSLPNEIAFKIVSLLEVSDLCSLGSCSRFWREICESASLWQTLCKDRWPAIVLDNQDFEANSKSWRVVYARKHAEMREKSNSIVDFVERGSASYESIEGGHYLKGIEDMCSTQFAFQDIKMLFIKPEMNVMLNLVGLHYCIKHLNVPAKCMNEALHNENIQSREVCVQWWKFGRWYHGYRQQDDMQSRVICLADLATATGKEVLGVLHRGAVHEVLRVRISVSKPVSSTPWPCQYMPQYK